jgi:hypothetical protein
MIVDSNQLALAVGETADDVHTFEQADYTTAEGIRYAVCSTVAKPVVIELATSPLAAPAHAPTVDLTAAQRVQNTLQIYNGDPLELDGTAMIAVIDLPPMEALSVLGLTPYEMQE